MQIIVTNVHLKHYKIITTNVCSFCKEEKESYVHLFWKCKVVQELWKWVKNELKLTSLTFGEMFTNDIIDNPKLMANAVVLVVKYFIYMSQRSTFLYSPQPGSQSSRLSAWSVRLVIQVRRSRRPPGLDKVNIPPHACGRIRLRILAHVW